MIHRYDINVQDKHDIKSSQKKHLQYNTAGNGLTPWDAGVSPIPIQVGFAWKLHRGNVWVFLNYSRARTCTWTFNHRAWLNKATNHVCHFIMSQQNIPPEVNTLWKSFHKVNFAANIADMFYKR